MFPRQRCLALTILVAFPTLAHAAPQKPLDLPAWTIAPFVILLLAIAILPLVAGHWWHSNRNKTMVSAAVSVPVAAYLAYVHLTTPQHALEPLVDEITKYFAFILLLGSLYTVSGGIVLRGDLLATPLTNALFLGLGGKCKHSEVT